MATYVAVGLSAALLVVLVSVGLVSALYVVFSFGVWLLERRKLEADGLPRARVDLNGAVATEVLSAGYLLLSHPFCPVSLLPPAPVELQGRRPIILLFGFAGVRTSLSLLGLRLRAMGRGPIYTADLYDWRPGIAEHAQALSRFIDEVMRASGAREVDVVAHSLSGVVARVAEARHAKRRVRRLVTLGTPHQGTELARLLGGESAADLRPGSLLLSSLPPPPLGMIVSISSRTDNAVVPSENGRIGQGGRDVVLDGVGHLSMLMHAEVAEEVAKALGEDIRGGQVVLAPLPEERAALQGSVVG